MLSNVLLEGNEYAFECNVNTWLQDRQKQGAEERGGSSFLRP